MYCVKKFSTSIELILKKNNTELINKTDEDVNDNIILKKFFILMCKMNESNYNYRQNNICSRDLLA